LKHFYGVHSTNGKWNMLVKRAQVSIVSDARMCLVIVYNAAAAVFSCSVISMPGQNNALCLPKPPLKWVAEWEHVLNFWLGEAGEGTELCIL
jgi:hypothetical protein